MPEIKRFFTIIHVLLIYAFGIEVIALIALLEPMLDGKAVFAFILTAIALALTTFWLTVIKVTELTWNTRWKKFLKGEWELASVLVNPYLVSSLPKSYQGGIEVDSIKSPIYTFMARNENEARGFYLIFGIDDQKVWYLPMDYIPKWVVDNRVSELNTATKAAFEDYHITKPLRRTTSSS